MTALSEKLGASYSQARDRIKTKAIEITIGEGRFTLKVNIPVKKDMEKIMEEIAQPSKEKTDQTYQKLSQPILEAYEKGGDEFKQQVGKKVVVLDTDVIVDNTSIRQVALFTAMWETKVEKFFGLLQSETGEPVNETYEQIADEFPESVIRQIVEEIESSVKPDYKTAKKN